MAFIENLPNVSFAAIVREGLLIESFQNKLIDEGDYPVEMDKSVGMDCYFSVNPEICIVKSAFETNASNLLLKVYDVEISQNCQKTDIREKFSGNLNQVIINTFKYGRYLESEFKNEDFDITKYNPNERAENSDSQFKAEIGFSLFRSLYVTERVKFRKSVVENYPYFILEFDQLFKSDSYGEVLTSIREKSTLHIFNALNAICYEYIA